MRGLFANFSPTTLILREAASGLHFRGVTDRTWPPAAREAALTVRPASASGEPTTPAPDYPFKIEFTGWSRVEAILDFGAQPGELLAASLLMQDRGDDGGFAAAIPALAYLRSYEFLKRSRESYGDD